MSKLCHNWITHGSDCRCAVLSWQAPLFLYYNIDSEPGNGVLFSSLEAAFKYHAKCMDDLECLEHVSKEEAVGCKCHSEWKKANHRHWQAVSPNGYYFHIRVMTVQD